MKKICVVGGGNIGAVLFCELSNNTDGKVVLSAIDADKWKKDIALADAAGEVLYEVKNVETHTEDVYDADLYFFTLPKNVLFPVLARYVENAKEGSTFVFVPGTGGVEFCYGKAKERAIDFIGLQRPPYTARWKELGKTAGILSKKDKIFACSMAGKDVGFLGDILKIEVVEMNNYLDITFTPSNPILHTSRIYGMFSKHPQAFDHNVLFYEEWDDFSSETLLACDRELQNIISKINESLPTAVTPLSIYYESPTAEKMTRKLSSIKAFKGITSPMKYDETSKGYVVDLSSRYFKEDFDYGLVIIKAFGELTETKTPQIDDILSWYGELSGKEVFDKDGKLNGKSYAQIPQNNEINSLADVVKFYSK